MHEYLKTILEAEPTDFSIRKHTRNAYSTALSLKAEQALSTYEYY